MAQISNEKKALAKFLGVKRSEIKDGYDEHIFEVNGEEYFVGDYDASHEAAVDSVRNILEDIGLEAFSENIAESYLESFCNFQWEEAMHEDHVSYCEDIADEDGDDKFANRLVEECVDSGIIDESDCVENEEGKLDFEDKDRLVEEYATKIDEDFNSMGDYFENLYGRDWTRYVSKWLESYIDWNGIAENVIEEDGVANELARYDGVENSEEVDGETYYIYRQN